MDVTAKYFLVQKHIHPKSGGKVRRRKFHEAGELETMRALAEKYARETGEDFLIAQVVEEVSKKKPLQVFE